jgi:hypothetical protein
MTIGFIQTCILLCIWLTPPPPGGPTLSLKYGDSFQIDSLNKESITTSPYERIVFYNTENLFHPSNDSIKSDDEFTPSGQYHWTYNRYYRKISKLGKLFVAIGEGNLPAIIGLCEVEHRIVLNDILKKSVLKNYEYKIIHKESPDLRGIDVALLYDPIKFKAEKYTYIKINNTAIPEFNTREILHVSGRFYQKVPCQIFVNHWPSRRGGKLASDKKRLLVAKILKQYIDTCYMIDPQSNIIVMGDFNDEPVDLSKNQMLNACDPDSTDRTSLLNNLMYPHYKKGDGTHYRINNFTEASVLDQIIVSKAIYFGDNGMKLKNGQSVIYKNDFLFDKKNGRPLRTYQGLKYLGGYSDHLPVFTDVQIIK